MKLTRSLIVIYLPHDDLTTLKKNTEKCRDIASNILHNGTNSEIMSARKQMLERTKHLKGLHNGTQLSPVTKSTKTVSYSLDKINAEIMQIANLQQCCIEDVPSNIYVNETSTVNFFLKDAKGQPICNAASIVTAEVTTAAKNDHVTSSVKELGNGKYSMKFTPIAPEHYVISIQINKIHISKSPASIACDFQEPRPVLPMKSDSPRATVTGLFEQPIQYQSPFNLSYTGPATTTDTTTATYTAMGNQ